jgi:hypothetical protein
MSGTFYFMEKRDGQWLKAARRMRLDRIRKFLTRIARHIGPPLIPLLQGAAA